MAFYISDWTLYCIFNVNIATVNMKPVLEGSTLAHLPDLTESYKIQSL